MPKPLGKEVVGPDDQPDSAETARISHLSPTLVSGRCQHLPTPNSSHVEFSQSWPDGCLSSEAGSRIIYREEDNSFLQRPPPTHPPNYPAPLVGSDSLLPKTSLSQAELGQPWGPAHMSSLSCQKS